MARVKVAKKAELVKVSPKPAVEESEASNLIEPDFTASYPTVYSNFAQVSHSPHDLCLAFCLISQPHKVARTPKAVKLQPPVVARVLITPDMLDGLIEALQQQKTKYINDRKALRLEISAPGDDRDD